MLLSIQENDTRELLQATVSEVTLDNAFLREQVSIRDEQVLRLSRQVQELQVSSREGAGCCLSN
jgi:hypothetical protein